MYYMWLFFWTFLRSTIKWFLRKTTGLCELQRICYGEIPGARRVCRVEKSLTLSKSEQIQRMITYLNEKSVNLAFKGLETDGLLIGAIRVVIFVKKINPKIHPQFVESCTECIEKIWGYRQLIAEIEQIRSIKFESNNEEHEVKLFNLWTELMPETELINRISDQWQEIGFQGDDPSTDFRGMGLLGLENLLFFATEYKSACKRVLSHSWHPVYGYSFAIVGINLTSMALQFLRDGDAKYYFYNTSRADLNIDTFHRFYSFLYYEFDKFWLECKPVNMMEFSEIKRKFEKFVKKYLNNPDTNFKIDVGIDTI